MSLANPGATNVVDDRMYKHRCHLIPGLAAAVACAVCLATASVANAQEVVELPAEDRFLSADFKELYRVGSVVGGGWDTFGAVAAVDFDGVGNLHVLDDQAAQITVVDLEGGLVRQFGRRGEGPGELSGQAWAFSVWSDGRIAVYDGGKRAFVLFGADGGFDRQIPLEGPTFISIPALQADPARMSVVSTGEVQYLDWTPLARPSFRYVMRYGLSSDQAEVDTVAAGWQPETAGMAFAPVFKVGVLPDGAMAFTDSSTYRISILGPDGGLSHVLSRPLRPEPVTRQHRAEYLERELKAMEGSSGAWVDRRRAELESMQFHHAIPVVRDLRTSWEGTIWVRRVGDEPDSDGPIDLITADGRYLGSFADDATDLPSAFGRDGLVAFVERDELDVPTVVVKRLPPGVR